jgi:hypothetical protein
MGLSCSWVAVRAEKASVLEALGFAETDQQALPGTRAQPFTGAQRPGGWFVVLSEDSELFGEADVIAASALGPAVGCQMSETVMVSVAWGADAGGLTWSAAHDEEDGGAPFHFSADAPGAAEIRDRLLAEAAADPGADYLFDGPLEVAKAACGYRLEDVEDAFTALRSVRTREAPPRTPPRAAPPRAKGRGFFARLFGG